MANKKIDDALFWQVLEASGALCSVAVKIFKTQYGIDITRQAVYDRLQNHPDKKKQILERNCDVAESVILKNMKSMDGRLSQKAAEYYLDRQGKHRGYGQKTELEITGSTNQPTEEEVDAEIAEIVGRGQKKTTRTRKAKKTVPRKKKPD